MTPADPRTEATFGVAAVGTGLGLVMFALFPLALPIVVLTIVALLPLLVPAVVLAAVGALVAGLWLGIRGLGRGVRRLRPRTDLRRPPVLSPTTRS